MIRWLLLVLAFALPGCTRSDGPRSPALSTAPRQASEIVAFRLHKFMQEIGTERDTYRPVAGGLEAKATFAFRDRGMTVSLAAAYRLAADGAVRAIEAWGSTPVVEHRRCGRAAPAGLLVAPRGHRTRGCGAAAPLAAPG